MQYIYRTTIQHPKYGVLTYVGSHVWDGEGIDPSYLGSCKYRYFTNWTKNYPTTCEILEVVNGDRTYRLTRESYWIELELLNMGSFLRDIPRFDEHGPHSRSNLNKYKRGKCLNGHTSNAETINTPEVQKKALCRKIDSGGLEKFIQSGCNAAREVRIANGASTKQKEVIQKMLQASNTPEVHSKAAKKAWENRSEESIMSAMQRSSETRRKNGRKIKVTTAEGEEYVGCQSEIDTYVSKYLGRKFSVSTTFSKIWRGILPNPYYPTSCGKGKTHPLVGWKFEIYESKTD